VAAYPAFVYVVSRAGRQVDHFIVSRHLRGKSYRFIKVPK